MFLTSGTKTTYDKHIVAPNRDWSAKLYYYYNGSWYSLGTTNLQSLQISDYSTDGSNITMGTVVGGKLTVNLIKVASSVVGRLTKGTAIRINFILNSLASTSSTTLTSRVFVIDDSKLTLRAGGSYNVSLTAYDFSYKMTDKFVASASKMTAKEILTQIADKYGFTIGESVDSVISEFESVTGGIQLYTPIADTTCKQTVGYMAGCYGCFAYFDEELQLQFAWYESNGDIVDSSRIFSGNSYISEMEERTIVMLETGTSDNPIVVPNNTKGFSINFENPYITQTQAEAVYNKRIVDGKLTFKIGKLSYRGNPLNSPGAIISVKDINRGEYPFYIMKRTLRYDGGLSETIECQGESETTINYKLTSPTQQKINRALSRMEEAIKAATDAITQTKGSIFELIPIDENDTSKGNAGFKIHYQDTGTSAFDDCVIMGTAGGVGLSTNNGETFATAMYFYQDPDTGEIHGCINGEVIRAGSISADKIDTSQLMVSTGNVTGLDAELAGLLAKANAADTKAGNAQTTANTANNNASNALSVANSANGKIANWASANNTTLIDGAKIYTGSITADKLSVGTGVELNQFYNDEFYDGTRGWYGYNGSLTAQGTNQSWAYMQFKPSNSGISAIMQKVWLVNGQRYSIMAQIYPLNWSQNASTYYIRPFYGIAPGLVGDDLRTAYNYNGETVVKMVFDYDGDTGFVDLGIAFSGIMASSTTPSTINIAWISFSDATNETVGFYCSRKEWLASGYKDSNFLAGSVGGSTTADTYLAKKALTIDVNGNLVTLGTIKSNNGEIGSMVYSRERMDIVSHSYYKILDVPAFGASRISFINPLEYYEFTTSDTPEKNNAEYSKKFSARIEVASSSEISGISGNEYTMITSSGVSVSDSSGHSSISATGIDIDGVSLTKAELTALKKLI